MILLFLQSKLLCAQFGFILAIYGFDNMHHGISKVKSKSKTKDSLLLSNFYDPSLLNLNKKDSKTIKTLTAKRSLIRMLGKQVDLEADIYRLWFAVLAQAIVEIQPGLMHDSTASFINGDLDDIMILIGLEPEYVMSLLTTQPQGNAPGLIALS